MAEQDVPLRRQRALKLSREQRLCSARTHAVPAPGGPRAQITAPRAPSHLDRCPLRLCCAKGIARLCA